MTETTTAGRRADARRNIAKILDAAVERLSEDPASSVGTIAKAAGVGRVTLYGHFASRDVLVEAAVRHAIDRGEEQLSGLDLSGDPRAALDRLIVASWELVAQFHNLLIAAQDSLSPARIRALHDKPVRRAADLIERGQDVGVFRSDVPVTWLVGVLHNVIHGAADEISAGRLDVREAPRAISAIILAAYTPPGRRTPQD
jgi:TetR/AcrR family transcriptional regulator, mexCD-oprJ operon repressor